MTALALALLLVLGAGGCTPQKKGSAGILYRVTGGKSDLYLLGSIHVGSEDMYPMGQYILDAMEAADVLAFECDTASAQAQAAYQELMRCPEGDTLETLVSAVLYGLSPALQESLLRSTCCVILNPDSATGMDAVIDRWPDWWRMGDAEAFARAYLDGMAAEPAQDLAREYHAALVTERNMRMARQMAQWLEGENTCFVTLGLLHLVLSGDSVLSCLEEMGYTVERILPENV